MLPMSLSHAGLLNQLTQKKEPGFLSDPNSLGLLQAGAQMLAMSGPSAQKTNVAQVLGTGLSGYVQGRQQAEDNQFNRQYKQFQMQQGNGIIGDVTPGNYTPESLAAFSQEYQATGKPNYALLKESVNPFRAGGVTYTVGPDGKPKALIDVSTVAGNAGAISSAQAGGSAAGKETAEAAAALPGVEDNSKNTIALIDQVLNHPGLPVSVGKSSLMKPEIIPGSHAADFVSKLDQLQGKQFLEAYQQLKGGGTITEQEGAKAETALNNLSRSQSEEQFRANLNELKTIIQQGVDRAKLKAGVIAKPTTQAEFDNLKSGDLYIDPDDGKQYRKP